VTQPINIDDATRISRNPSILVAEVDAEIVMMGIQQGQYFGLDNIGSDIWKRIDPPCLFADLVDALTRDYNAERATIAADVSQLLRKMAAHNVVSLS
jgi:hypothetical protein